MIHADTKDRAAQNRAIVAAGIGNDYYDRLNNQVNQWPMGEPCPPWLELGELPVLARPTTAPKYTSFEED